MKNLHIAKIDEKIASLSFELAHIDDLHADVNSQHIAADLIHDIQALTFQRDDAKRILFNNVFMDARSRFAHKYFICANGATPAPSNVIKRLAFILRPHVAKKNLRQTLFHAAQDLCEFIGKDLDLSWELTQGERDDSFTVDFTTPVREDAPGEVHVPAYTGQPNAATLATLKSVVDKEWKTLVEAIVTEQRIDSIDFHDDEDASPGTAKREAIITALQRMAEHDLLYHLSTLPESDGGDFQEVLEDLDGGFLPVSEAKQELIACIEARM